MGEGRYGIVDRNSNSGDVSSREVHAQLQRILSSELFRRSERQRHFLRFVVERVLAGTGESIKEYVLGIEVFGRRHSYDPKNDPVVRIEAGRLRSRLAEYYRSAGADDLILIDLPKGAYIPVFQPRRDKAGAGNPSPASEPQKRWLYNLLFAAIAIISLASFLSWRFTRKPKLSQADTVIVADFANHTGDPVFDRTLKQALSTELQRSSLINVLSPSRTTEMLKFMRRSAEEPLTGQVAADLCVRSGGKALVSGSISEVGSQYLVALEATACENGDVLAKDEAEATSKERVLPALRRAATNVRARLGELLPSRQKFISYFEETTASGMTELHGPTTSSAEALKAFGTGVQVANTSKGSAEAVPFFQRAIELDPDFASAYLALGTQFSNLSEPTQAAENIRKAYELRDSVSEREKLEISGAYYGFVTGEIDKAIETGVSMVRIYPQDAGYRINLGLAYGRIGQWDKMVSLLEDVPPGPSPVFNGDLAAAYLATNRTDKAKNALDRSLTQRAESGFLRQEVYLLAFLTGDTAGMKQQVSWAAGRPGDEDALLSMQSDTMAFYGKLAKARQFSRAAVDSAIRAGDKEAAAAWEVNAALRETEFGNNTEAKRGVAAAFALSRGREVTIASALVLARIGDQAGTQHLLKALHNEQPLGTILNFYWLPTIRAVLEMNGGKAAQACALLQSTESYELGQPTFVSDLYPAYVRGQVYLKAHDGAAAVMEFQKLIDHPGIVLNFPTGALAHLQLGRAYILSGDKNKAKAAYQDFFALWKDADPDIPILKEAKAEYAKLQ
jgi:eukaryotic-like serine/threonine-protein kinase